MINLGLETAELNKLIELLFKPHWIKVTVRVLDLNHNNLGDLSHRLMAGQVNFNAEEDVSRTAELTLFDPNAATSLNPDSPSEGALFMDKMIQIIYSVADPWRTKWYDIPLFMGPVQSVSRDEYTVTVNCAGKDSLGFASVWDPRTFGDGREIKDVIRWVLFDVMGEFANKVKFHIKSKETLDGDVAVSRDSVPWRVIKSLARALNGDAYYDGRGFFALKKFSNRSVFTFTDRHITQRPNFTYDPSTLVNAVRVEGGKPKGSDQKKIAVAVASAGHPFSPQRLGRNGKPRYYAKIIEDDKLKKQKQVDDLAWKELKRGLIQSVEMQMEVLPFPLLEEGDIFTVDTDDVKMQARFMQGSIPLTHDGLMTLGTIRRVSWKTKKKIRHPKPKKKPKKPPKGGNK